MKFVSGSPPETFAPGEQWRRLDEPEPQALMRHLLPLMIVAVVTLPIIWGCIGLKRGAWQQLMNEPTLAFHVPIMFISFLGMVVVHEMIHGVCQPGWGVSDQTVYGVMRKEGFVYAFYEGELSRNRLLMILLAPFCVITLFPLLLVWHFTVPPILFMYLAWYACLNGISAAADLYGSWLIWQQVPASARVRNRGWFTYWTTANLP
ncbi:DUF3267 domain-containing protein [Burkholderiaceae bacterium DAT-1]|nr:DUF3267 domain-containing protein [Burkholderiaceae bacterium DAT-1]